MLITSLSILLRFKLSFVKLLKLLFEHQDLIWLALWLSLGLLKTFSQLQGIVLFTLQCFMRRLKLLLYFLLGFLNSLVVNDQVLELILKRLIPLSQVSHWLQQKIWIILGKKVLLEITDVDPAERLRSIAWWLSEPGGQHRRWPNHTCILQVDVVLSECTIVGNVFYRIRLLNLAYQVFIGVE